MNKTNINRNLFLIVILLITFYYGLKPEGYRFTNNVEVRGDTCIAFTNIGMMYSEKTLGEEGFTDKISIAINLMPYNTDRRKSCILTIIDKDGNPLLKFEQWLNGIFITLINPVTDKSCQIGTMNILETRRYSTVIITISEKWLKIATLKCSDSTSNTLQLPKESIKNGRIILGFSANGTDPWHGEITGCSFFRNELADSTQEYILSESQTGNGMGFRSMRAIHADGAVISIINDGEISENTANLINFKKPILPKVFRKKVLSGIAYKNKRIVFSDVLINLFGFIPLGISSFIALSQYFKKNKFKLMAATGFCLAVSLAIELLQVYIPTRTSQITDVLLNCTGACIGVILIITKGISGAVFKRVPGAGKVIHSDLMDNEDKGE